MVTPWTCTSNIGLIGQVCQADTPLCPKPSTHWHFFGFRVFFFIFSDRPAQPIAEAKAAGDGHWLIRTSPVRHFAWLYVQRQSLRLASIHIGLVTSPSGDNARAFSTSRIWKSCSLSLVPDSPHASAVAKLNDTAASLSSWLASCLHPLNKHMQPTAASRMIFVSLFCIDYFWVVGGCG